MLRCEKLHTHNFAWVGLCTPGMTIHIFMLVDAAKVNERITLMRCEHEKLVCP